MLLLKPYISYRQRAAKPLPPIEVQGAAEYEVEEILRSGYICGIFCYPVKWIGDFADKAKWLLERCLEHALNLIREIHESHPTQLKPPHWGLRSQSMRSATSAESATR